jgi:SnoaL-like domain
MKTVANHRTLLGALGAACCLALAFSSTATAQEITAKTVVDQARILNLIQHYYYNFGRENPENFSDFYADDAELILGTKHYKGKEGIMQAYGRGAAPPAPAGGGAAPAAAPAPERPRLTFNVTISNPLITVHGDTATSELIFTEYRQEKQGDPMKMTTQGREYSTFVRVKGQWRYKSRHIMGGNEPPEDWKE